MIDLRAAARWGSVVALLGCTLATGGELWAQTQSLTVSRQKVTPDPTQEANLPRQLRDLGWEQQIGRRIPSELQFTRQDGSAVKLADLVGERPVVLAPVYYDCPMLCSLVLDGVVRGLKPLNFQSGQDFDVVAVSFDPGETPELAQRSLNTALARYGEDKSDDGSGWSFLTGDEANVSALMDSIGFRYRYDPQTDEYAHAGGVVLLTQDGTISRYFYGVDFAPKDLRLGLVEASENQLGSVVDQVLLFCYQYDPAIGKYSALSMNIIRVAGVLTVLLLGGFIFRMLRKERSADRVSSRHASAT